MNPLEEWIHSFIRTEVAENPELQEYIRRKHLGRVTNDDVRKYTLGKLRNVIHYAYKKSPFYRELFREENISPEDIKSIQDLTRIPFTKSEDISENPYQFLCVSQNKILRGFTVEELLGPKRRIFFMKKELKETVEAVSVGLEMVGLKAGNVVQITYPWEPEWGLPDIVKRGVQLRGGEPVLAEALKFEKQIEEIEENNPSVIIGPNPYLRELTEWAKNRFDLRQLKVSSLVLSRGCNFFPFSEHMREDLEEAWGCKTYDHYGITEASFTLALECWEQNGLHLNERDVYVEVVDFNSGETVDIGEEGELVFTTLNRRGMPFIRYRSGDIATVIDEPCECGAKVNRRITGIKRKIPEVI